MKVKKIKSICPYFNKILSATKKETVDINIEIKNNRIICVMNDDDDVTYGLDINLDELVEGFENKLLKYKEFIDICSKLKASMNIDLIVENDKLVSFINGDRDKEATIIKDNNIEAFNGVDLFKTKDYLLLKSFNKNKVFAKKGMFDYQNNTFLNLENSTLSITSTNEIGIALSQINVKNEIEKKSICLKNEYIPVIVRWLNAIKELEIVVSVSDSVIEFKTESEFLRIPTNKCINVDKTISMLNNFRNCKFEISEKFELDKIKMDLSNLIKEAEKDAYSISIENVINSKINVQRVLFKDCLNSMDEYGSLSIVDSKLKILIFEEKDEELDNIVIFNSIINN